MSIASRISVSGMDVAALRLQVSASNVASSLSDGPMPGTANAAGYPSAYVPLRVDQVSTASGGTSASVGVVTPSYLSTYDPSAPYADSNGMVASPNVDLPSEIAQQIVARYDFAANANVLRADAQMMATLLNITC